MYDIYNRFILQLNNINNIFCKTIMIKILQFSNNFKLI